LVELDLFACSELGCFYLIQLWTYHKSRNFDYVKSQKLGNLLVELRKLQSFVELDLFGCFELGRLLDSIMDLSQLKTFRLQRCHKLENLQMKFGKLQSLVELDI
jgi:hypothetical protein